MVRGGHWKTQCGGASDDGRKWYRVVSVNGKSVSRLYGQKAVYGARSLFDVVYVPLETACGGVRLRTDTPHLGDREDQAAGRRQGHRVGHGLGRKLDRRLRRPVRGTSWYRITKIGDRRACPSMFGVKALYAARGLLRSTAVEVPPPPDTSGFIEGIDVSHWQGTIGWPDVAAAGKRFAFMKASEGTKYVDPTYATNRAQANANGIKVGAYHFAKPDTGAGDAVAEADHFIATASWSSGDLLPVLDLEVTGGLGHHASSRPGSRRSSTGSTPGPGERAMIYTSPNFWKTNMGDTTSFAAAGYRTLWVAHWTTRAVRDRPGRQLGRDRLDVLAVHLGRVGARDQRAASTSTATATRTSAGSPSARRPAGPVLDAAVASPRLLATWTRAAPRPRPTAGTTPGRVRTRSSTSSARR